MTSRFEIHYSYDHIPKITYRFDKNIYEELHTLEDCLKVLRKQENMIESLLASGKQNNELFEEMLKTIERQSNLINELEKVTQLSIEDMILNYGGELDE